MLIRYCAAHPEYFGYPRFLGVRWKGWRLSTSGGLCEACRERERERWRPDPYGSVLIPVPVELGPRMLGRRVLGAFVAAALAAAATTAALLAVHPPDLIPWGGEPGLFGSGAQLAASPPAQAEGDEVEAISAPPEKTPSATRRVVTTRAALTSRDGAPAVVVTRARSSLKGQKAVVHAARPVIAPQSP